MVKQLFKKTFPIFLGAFVCAYLLFPQTASAAVWDWIVGAITFLPNAIINLALQILVLIWGALANLAGQILDWVTSPGFISWSYTNPAQNPVIGAGYSITRSFVNMGLVLALIYIAFATILRTGSFQTQKTLITLIVVALLVNFAPILCGFVVDASNIAMFYFTDHLTGMSNLLNTLKGMGDSIAAGFTTIEVTKQFGIVFQTLILIAFNMALFFILAAFCVIFIVRYVAIWVAVILAPLALVAYILPSTRRFYDTWLKQFLQWNIIGIVGGFFLFLGEQVAEIMPAAPMLRTGSEYGVVDAILPHFVTLAFLIIGLMMALTTSAKGADQIFAGAKRGGKAAGKVIGISAAGAAWKITKAPAAAFKSGRQAWDVNRGLGHSWRRSAGAALERAGAAVRLETTGELRPAAMVKSVSRGTLKAFKGAAIAGGTAALGIKTKKKGFRPPCPDCGNKKISVSSPNCTACGHVF